VDALRTGLAGILAAAAMLAVSMVAAPRALACSLDPDYDPTPGAVAVVYGRFDRIAHDPAFAESLSDPQPADDLRRT
jgi:hypothetical protein